MRALLDSEPDKALAEAEALLERLSREIALSAARAGVPDSRRRLLLDLAFNLKSAARSMKASRARLRAARSEGEIETALSDARTDMEEAESYVRQAQALLAREVD